MLYNKQAAKTDSDELGDNPPIEIVIKKESDNDNDEDGDNNNGNGRDRIIKIANLFGKAYRLIVTPTIPSGRPDGKVSNLTFRQYIYLGKEHPGTPDKPGYGPWASRRLFDKFKGLINHYIEEERFRKIFNAGKIKRTDGRSMKGNVLLEFIRDMTDENTLKNFDKNRSNLLNKYFGLEYTNKADGQNINTDKSNPSVQDSTNLRWITQENAVKKLDKGSFVAINCDIQESGKLKNKVLVGQVIGFNNGKVFIKYCYDTEAISEAYSGYEVLPEAERLDGCSPKREAPVHLAVLDLNSTPLIENTAFVMSNVTTDHLDNNKKPKPNEIFKKRIIPVKSVKKPNKPSRKHNVAVAILCIRHGKNDYEPVLANIKANTRLITHDIEINGDDIYMDLIANLEDNSIVAS